MKARTAATGLLVAVLTACGTTVPRTSALTADGSGLTAPEGLAADGTALPAQAGTGAGTTALTTSSGPVPRTAPGTAGGTTSAGAVTKGAARTSTGSAPAAGGTRTVARGGDLVIGFRTAKNGAGAVSSLGISGASTGDLENQMKTIVGQVNARGGVLGHRLVLAAHDAPAVESDPSTADTAACASWVDRKAFVVVNVTARPVLRTCLAKAGIPIISSLSISSPASLYGDTLPGIYAPSAMSIDRSTTAVVDRLVARGFFTGWDATTGRPGPQPVKIGMQSFDDADGRHVVDVARRALARHGLKLDVVEAHSTNLSDNSSSTSSAVLRFRAGGVTHVIDANLLFFQNAASQDYHPRYVVQDTINSPALLAQNVPASQLHGAMGAGFLPYYEVPSPQDPSVEATRCKAIMRKAGEDTTQAVALVFMLQACDAVLFLERALTAGGEVSAAGLRTGVSRLGAFPSHLTYGSRLTVGVRDGASRIRDFDYADACSCFRHPSATTYPVP